MKAALSLLFAVLILTSFASFAKEDYQHPGGLYLLSLDKRSPIPPAVRFGIKEVAVLEYENEWMAIIGIPLKQLPGEYLVYYRQSGTDEVANFIKFDVQAQKTLYLDSLDIKLPPEVRNISDLDFENSTPPKVPLGLPLESSWKDDFGVSSSDAGDKITVVNFLYTRAQERSLVRAPQSGFISKIATAQDGTESIVIDHGQGLFSLIHGLTDLTVEVGNGVANRAVIGKVAIPVQSELASATDEARLSRISWQVQLNGVFVNPVYLTKLKAN